MTDIKINGTTVAAPRDAVAYKYQDPVEEAKWIYDPEEAREIEREDPGLIVWVEEQES